MRGSICAIQIHFDTSVVYQHCTRAENAGESLPAFYRMSCWCLAVDLLNIQWSSTLRYVQTNPLISTTLLFPIKCFASWPLKLFHSCEDTQHPNLNVLFILAGCRHSRGGPSWQCGVLSSISTPSCQIPWPEARSYHTVVRRLLRCHPEWPLHFQD